ncbi:MAG: hypothetical protein ABI893_11645 [Polaromonas sp.]
MLEVLNNKLRKWMREAAARREFAQASSAFAGLDASTIRDLGMSRSEFSSHWAETHGLAEQTRVRVLMHATENDCRRGKQRDHTITNQKPQTPQSASPEAD